MAVIEDLKINFSVGTAALAAGLNKGRGMLNNFGKALTSTKGLLVGLGTALASKAVFDSFVGAVNEGVDAVDQLTDTASHIGTTTKALSELRHAANMTGSSGEALDKALQKMQVNLGKITGATSPAAKALSAIGVNYKDLEGLDPSEKFKAIADGFQNQTDPAKRSAAALAIFGKAGVELVDTLKIGSSGLTEFQEQARKLGISIDDIDANKVGPAKDALDNISAMLGGIKGQLAIQLAPYIEGFATKFTEWATSGTNAGDLIRTSIGYVAEGIAIAADVVGTLKLAFDFAAAGITIIIGDIVNGLSYLTGALKKVSEWLGQDLGFGTDFLTTFGGDLTRKGEEMMEGVNKSFIGKSWGESVRNTFKSMETSSQNAAQAVVDNFKSAQEQIASGFEGLTIPMSGMAFDVAEHMQKALKEKFDSLKDDAKGIFDDTRTPLEKYKAKLEELFTMRDSGLFKKLGGEDTFNRAIEAARKDFVGSAKADTSPQFAGALEVGSVEGRSAMLAQRFGQKDPINDVAANTKKQVEQGKRLVIATEKLANKNNIVKIARISPR